MGLAEQNRKDIVIYRIERAFAALEQAKSNLQMHYLEITANRLYYAAYYAASALLIANEIRVKSHEGSNITAPGPWLLAPGRLQTPKQNPPTRQ